MDSCRYPKAITPNPFPSPCFGVVGGGGDPEP